MGIKVGYIIAARVPLLSPKGDSVHIHSFLENFMKIGGKVFLIRYATRKKVINEKTDVKTYTIKWIGSIPSIYI